MTNIITRVCADCRKKFDVDSSQPRKFPGICDECTPKHKEVFLVGGQEYEIDE